MGWMTWQRFRCETNCKTHPTDCINENLIIDMADRLSGDGYLDAGYEYIIIDDCWASKSRDHENKLVGDPDRFPNGMKALSDYVHSKGLKFGIYGDYGTYTCEGYPGSLDYLQLDAQTWAGWGVDYLKLDGCHVQTEGMEQGYGKMTKDLNATGRPIVFSCSFPAYLGINANYTAAVEYCNLWRTYADISDTFEDVKDIADWFGKNQNKLIQYAGPGHWNDPDMLIIGNYGLSYEQSKVQMSIWAILAAPLIMSVDLRTITKEAAGILQNKDLIRINQDPLGIQGSLIKKENNINIWRRIIKGQSAEYCEILAFVSYRVDGVIYQYPFTLSELLQNSIATQYIIRNVWDDSDAVIAFPNEELISHIKPSGVDLYEICPLVDNIVVDN
ncbi:alpha-N-acetylgalactosaminidase-like [Aethina tumida]|uniref:alpha-N-acetylgalactosaminidase-like n=1 Tax=Aethina tumida TaxID=116153 RepID=UPI00214986BA|nr:alpha-N-acetylgalactosaminidase-like [Aethina tumida]